MLQRQAPTVAHSVPRPWRLHRLGGVLWAVAGAAAAGNVAPTAAASGAAGAATRSHTAQSAAALPAPPAGVSAQDLAARLSAADCKPLGLDPAPVVALQQILHPLGLGVRILGCPAAPAPLNQRVLAITAVVLDGDKAIGTVRGALGDGEEVDMGSDYRPQPWPDRQQAADRASLDDEEVSPDVRFNRRWLRSVMASQGYASVTGPWWAFIPVQPRRR